MPFHCRPWHCFPGAHVNVRAACIIVIAHTMHTWPCALLVMFLVQWLTRRCRPLHASSNPHKRADFPLSLNFLIVHIHCRPISIETVYYLTSYFDYSDRVRCVIRMFSFPIVCRLRIDVVSNFPHPQFVSLARPLCCEHLRCLCALTRMHSLSWAFGGISHVCVCVYTVIFGAGQHTSCAN